MKKTLVVIVAAAFLLIGAQAWASCVGADCYGGEIDVYTTAYGKDHGLTEEYGSNYGSSAAHSGQGGATGHMTGHFSGTGEIEGHLSVTGRSEAEKKTYNLDIKNGQGVGASSTNWSAGSLSGSIEAEGTGRYDLNAYGLAESTTCVGSYFGGDVNNAPTYGLAEQISQGYFIGQGGETFDGNIYKEFNAEVRSFGHSYSESYEKGFTADDGSHVSAMGTNVGTFSEVQMVVDNIPEGTKTGWLIEGSAGTVTEQSSSHKAAALGSYCAEGTGGAKISGSAQGYSHTSTVNTGMGQVRHSQAGMGVKIER